MSDHTTCQQAKEDAAIALLTRREPPADVLAHLEACPPCKDEFDQLAALPGLLGATRETLGAGPPEPPEPPRPQLLDRLLDEVHRRRRRRRSAIGLLAAAAAAAAVTAVIVSGGGSPSSTTGGSVAGATARTATSPAVTTVSTSAQLVAAGTGSDARSGADARVTVLAEGIGSAVTVQVHGWPAGKPCRMVVHDISGQAREVGIWTVDAGDASTYVEAVDLPPTSIARVELLDDRTGRAMIDVRVERI